MFAWSAATGRSGVTVSFESLSFSEDDERDLEADENALPGSILGLALNLKKGLCHLFEALRLQTLGCFTTRDSDRVRATFLLVWPAGRHTYLSTSGVRTNSLDRHEWRSAGASPSPLPLSNIFLACPNNITLLMKQRKIVIWRLSRILYF